MRVLLVEPLGHWEGHFTAHTKHLAQTLVNAGVDVTLLTFDGLLGKSTELDAEVKHISFLSQTGVLKPLLRCLPHLFPSKFIQGQLDRIFSTICTFFLALRRSRMGKYEVVHVLDACVPDYAFPLFASITGNCSLVFTLYDASIKTRLENWGARFRESLSKRQIMMGFQLWLIRLLGTRPATTLREFLYRRGAERNRLAFICYTSAVRDSYSGSSFHNRIMRMLRGAELPEAQPLTKGEAREHLGLSQNRIMLLHFGANHPLKNFKVIFEALRDLQSDYKLVFAGKVNLVNQANIPWKLAQKYGLQQNTITVDRYLTDEEARYYFYAADAVILSHRNEFKGASGVLSTAAQYNLPVIAADVGEIGNMVKNYKLGLTFEAENPESLRESILSFLDINEEEKRKIKRNLSCFAQTHSWQEVAQRHIELYQKLLQNSAVS